MKRGVSVRKQLKKLLLISLVLASFTACARLPITVCISDGDAGFDCDDERKKHTYIPFEESEGMIAFSPEDLEFMINYYKAKCQD